MKHTWKRSSEATQKFNNFSSALNNIRRRIYIAIHIMKFDNVTYTYTQEPQAISLQNKK